MDDTDHSTRAAMIVVAAIVISVVAGVIGFSAIRATRPHTTATQSPGEAPEAVGEALVKIYFEIGSADLLPETGGALRTVYETAHQQPSKIVLISGFHDPSGDPVKNAELALRRASAARDALIASGLPAERIRLSKPKATSENGDNQEARRVEIRVQ